MLSISLIRDELEQDIPNFEPIEIHATGEDGVVWTVTTDTAGLFNMPLLNGTWSFTIPDAAYNADTVSDYQVLVEDGQIQSLLT